MSSSFTCQLGLSIGESFAEVSCLNPPLHKRWYLAKKSLAEGLKGIFSELPVGNVRLQVASSVVERSLARGQGQSPAILVASGFETWYRTRIKTVTPAFTFQPRRAENHLEQDFFFGISGRLRAIDGQEESPLRTEELEFLESKLSLLKVKHLVVMLPHAGKSPTHEERVAEFFSNRGFKVLTSHSYSVDAGADPVKTLLELSEIAFAGPAVEDEKAQIESVLAAVSTESTNTLGEWRKPGRGVRDGLEEALRTANTEAETCLHLGLDHFYVLAGGRVESLGLSASQSLTLGEWSFPGLGETSVGLTPGPMLFGKSQWVSILDILFVLDRLQPIEGLTALINEKSRPRILETLLAWGKTGGLATGPARLDPKQIAEDIESVFIDRLAQDVFLGLKGRVDLQGALALTLLPLLKKRRPDLELRLKPDAEWSESLACVEPLPEASR